MDEFMLIFRHQDGNKVASPEQIQIWMKQTRDWMGIIAAQNKLVGGNGLPFLGDTDIDGKPTLQQASVSNQCRSKRV